MIFERARVARAIRDLEKYAGQVRAAYGVASGIIREANPTAQYGQIVRHIQVGLAMLGYEPGWPNGVLRPDTKAAIDAFEAAKKSPSYGRDPIGFITELNAKLSNLVDTSPLVVKGVRSKLMKLGYLRAGASGAELQAATPDAITR